MLYSPSTNKPSEKLYYWVLDQQTDNFFWEPDSEIGMQKEQTSRLTGTNAQELSLAKQISEGECYA
jgi:hypothetical protein